MIRNLCIGTILFALAAPVSAVMAQDQGIVDASGNLNSLIARHAAANNVPEDLVRRIIRRESRGNARAISKGNYGLMQIRLGTARAMGYRGTAAGLLDADTNMTYAVKYLAGAYHVADGNANRAVSYYAAGYYYAAKRRGELDAVKNPTPTVPFNLFNVFASAPAADSAGTKKKSSRARNSAQNSAVDVATSYTLPVQ
jgi:soluble lytic murein transglycosylase-like protein